MSPAMFRRSVDSEGRWCYNRSRTLGRDRAQLRWCGLALKAWRNIG